MRSTRSVANTLASPVTGASGAGVEVAALEFHGYKNVIKDELQDAVAVLDGFHIVKVGTQAVDEVRRRVQQETRSHRGRRDDPLYGDCSRRFSASSA